VDAVEALELEVVLDLRGDWHGVGFEDRVHLKRSAGRAAVPGEEGHAEVAEGVSEARVAVRGEPLAAAAGRDQARDGAAAGRAGERQNTRREGEGDGLVPAANATHPGHVDEVGEPGVGWRREVLGVVVAEDRPAAPSELWNRDASAASREVGAGGPAGGEGEGDLGDPVELKVLEAESHSGVSERGVRAEQSRGGGEVGAGPDVLVGVLQLPKSREGGLPSTSIAERPEEFAARTGAPGEGARAPERATTAATRASKSLCHLATLAR